MRDWGKMTERGCYTLKKKHKNKLRDIANMTNTSESEHVRKALDLYFEHSESEATITKTNPELRD